MHHFGRRGRENQRDLKRDDFAVTRDGEGALYAYKVKDELTKKHQTDDAKSKGRMYEIKGNLMSSLFNTMFNRMVIDTLYIFMYMFFMID
jgi:hypothetical protein